MWKNYNYPAQILIAHLTDIYKNKQTYVMKHQFATESTPVCEKENSTSANICPESHSSQGRTKLTFIQAQQVGQSWNVTLLQCVNYLHSPSHGANVVQSSLERTSITFQQKLDAWFTI